MADIILGITSIGFGIFLYVSLSVMLIWHLISSIIEENGWMRVFMVVFTVSLSLFLITGGLKFFMLLIP